MSWPGSGRFSQRSTISDRSRRAPFWATRCGSTTASPFEGTYHSALAMLLMLLVPLMVFLMTPFIRPFRWSRLFLTYLIPVVPLVSLFDGLVSCLRTYSVAELRELLEGLEAENYQWEIGEVKCKANPIPVTYLIGVPIERAKGVSSKC